MLDIPPRTDPPAATIFPDSDGGGHKRLHIALGMIRSLFGHSGQPPDPTIDGWFAESFGLDVPTPGSWATWPRPWLWWWWSGSVAPARGEGHTPLILTELRTASELESTRTDSSPDVIFGVSGWHGAPNFPPITGLDDTNNGITDYLGHPDGPVPGDRPVYRILVRDDLAYGGAGAAWSGRAFLIETMVHELGHAATAMAIELYGEAYVVTELCRIFDRPTLAWDDPALGWADRVIEATAETFKDIAFPRKRYSNRTNIKLPDEAARADFIELLFDYIENPYWMVENRSDLHVVRNIALDNIGIADYVVEPPADQGTTTRWLLAISESKAAEVTQPTGVPIPGTDAPFDNTNVILWPPSGQLKLHWNFDYVGDWNTVGQYVFASPPPGNPDNYVHARFHVLFTDIGTSLQDVLDFTIGTIYANYPLVDLLTTGGTEIPDVNGIPPGHGDVVFTVPGDVLAAVPPEGCSIFFGQSSVTLPDYVVSPLGVAGQRELFPWIDYALERPRLPPRIIPEPTTPPALLGHIAAAAPLPRVLRIPHRLPGRITGGPNTVAISPPIPLTVTLGAQTLDAASSTATVVTTLGMASSGEVRITSPDGHSISFAYSSKTGTTLDGLAYLGGYQGVYPDGSHVYLN